MNTLLNILKDYNIILASHSPRRINLLKSLNLEFQVKPAHIDENIDLRLPPVKYSKLLAFRKADKIREELLNDSNQQRNNIIIGADTIVVLNNEIINKPKDENDAFQILNKLSNRSHFVYTGIALINTKNNKMLVDYSRTCVYFREIDKEEILEYIADGKTLDKAGSYGIQDDYGALFVRKIEGCYNNVLGLPIELLRRRLLEIID